MKLTKLLALLVLPLAAYASSTGLVGTGYVSLTADLGDLRTPVTSKALYGATLGVNLPVLPYLDIGGTVQSQRLTASKLDINNLQGIVDATAHSSLVGVTYYARGGVGWAFNRTGVHKFQALAYRAGIGLETNPFKNLTVGAQAFFSDLQKANTPKAVIANNQRNYQPYAVFWLNDHLGVKGDYTYAQPANAATYSAGMVLKW